MTRAQRALLAKVPQWLRERLRDGWSPLGGDTLPRGLRYNAGDEAFKTVLIGLGFVVKLNSHDGRVYEREGRPRELAVTVRLARDVDIQERARWVLGDRFRAERCSKDGSGWYDVQCRRGVRRVVSELDRLNALYRLSNAEWERRYQRLARRLHRKYGITDLHPFNFGMVGRRLKLIDFGGE